MINLITVVYDTELSLLRTQASNFDLYVDPKDISKILILVNDVDAVADKINPAWWGQHTDKVQIKKMSEFDITWTTKQWESQQLLKLLGAYEADTEWSIVFDAKTWLTTKFDWNKMCDPKPRVGECNLGTAWSDAHSNLEKHYGISINEMLSPSGVPFVFHTQTVKDMMLEHGSVAKFCEWFQNKIPNCGVTEFTCYNAYLIYRYGSCNVLYNTQQIYPGLNTFCTNVANGANVDMAPMLNLISLTKSIHTRQYVNLKDTDMDLWKHYWTGQNMILNLDQYTISACVVVAHPDDCVIFAWPLIKMAPSFKWTIIYLTYDESHIRAKEVQYNWGEENIETKFCGLEDHYRDNEAGKLITWNPSEASDKLVAQCLGYDLIVTHGAKGEYGHIHHKFVHDVMETIDTPKIYFEDQDQANLIVTPEMYFNKQPNLDTWSEHREVIEMFKDRTTGNYKVSADAQSILNTLKYE